MRLLCVTSTPVAMTEMKALLAAGWEKRCELQGGVAAEGGETDSPVDTYGAHTT